MSIKQYKRELNVKAFQFNNSQTTQKRLICHLRLGPLTSIRRLQLGPCPLTCMQVQGVAYQSIPYVAQCAIYRRQIPCQSVLRFQTPSTSKISHYLFDMVGWSPWKHCYLQLLLNTYKTRWLYCVECPQHSTRLEALGYLCECPTGRVQR